jgi:hypothetical protein
MVPGFMAGKLAYLLVIFRQKYKNRRYQMINRIYLQYFRKNRGKSKG